MFSATASLTDVPNAGASYLFSEGGAGSCSNGGTATLNSSDNFTGTIFNANLAPGQYCIGIDANDPNDPAFALTFNTPVTGIQAVPEPSMALPLALVGLFGIWRLRKQS